jgi:hypothetical protein
MGSIVLCMTGAIHTCMLYTIVTVGCSASTFLCQNYTIHKYSTQSAAHSQGTSTSRGKGEDGDYERGKEDTCWHGIRLKLSLIADSDSQNMIKRRNVSKL